MKWLACLLLFVGGAWASGQAKTDRGPLRTAYTHVRTVVDGASARTVVTQVFVNDLAVPVEASYGFPLPADATVAGFAEWRDGRRVEAAATAKDAAEKAYHEAAAKGERAALAGTEGRARFRTRLAAIPARGQRRIELQYVQSLSALGGARSFTFPAQLDDAMVAAALDVEVVINGDRPLLSAKAPNHPDARVQQAGERATLHLSRAQRSLDTDLVVDWRQEMDDLDLATRSAWPDPKAPGFFEIQLAFDRDPYAGARAPRDVIVVLDRSLSMAGAPLANAKRVAQGIIDTLDPADRLEIVVFGDQVTPLLGGPRTMDEATRAAAEALLEAVRPKGRSDLTHALAAAGSLAYGQDPVVVLLTDGQPTAGDDPFTVQVDAALYANARVVYGQFNYPQHAGELAAALPNLTARYVPDGPAADDVIDSLVRLTTAAVIEDLDISVHGDVHSVHGALPHRLAAGEHVRVVGRANGPAHVMVSGTLHGEPVELSTAIDFDGDGDAALPTEWARQRIHELEVEYGGADQATRGALAGEIKSLGVDYNLATRFTSFVLTDSLAPDRIKPGDPEIRVHAPRNALGVFAILPWGEVIKCTWDEEEQLWLGRFLVPRDVPDGLYRARVFVEWQTGAAYRGALFFRVDSQPPPFLLEREDVGPVTSGDIVLLRATPADLFAADGTDRIDRDPLDLKTVEVAVGAHTWTLKQVGTAEVWEAYVPIDLPPGRHLLKLVAVDYARNTTTATLEVEVE